MDEALISEKMKELAIKIDYRYENLEHLKTAMCRRKIRSEGDGKNRKNYVNSAISTVGDSVLKLVSSESLYESKRDCGTITKARSDIEKNVTLSDLCEKMNIRQYAYNDESFLPEQTDHNKISIKEKHDSFIEAIMGAMFLDIGYDKTKDWVLSTFEKHGVIINPDLDNR